jgi:hypothetical protein
MEVPRMQSEQLTPSLLVIVPHAESEACRRLRQTLDGSGVRIVVDRRSRERSSEREAHRHERRARPVRVAALAAGKWFVVHADAGQVDVLDADARAILFLYCSQHAVPCEGCQETYRLGWLTRTETSLACPRCASDLTAVVVAHALCCENWTHRRRHGKPAVRVGGDTPPAQAASA